MALDAKHRSSIYGKLLPVLGEEDANALMSQYLEADEVVTKDFLRAELAEMRVEIAEGFRRQQAWLVATIAAATAVLGTLTSIF